MVCVNPSGHPSIAGAISWVCQTQGRKFLTGVLGRSDESSPGIGAEVLEMQLLVHPAFA
jgi:hypothetical protein